MGVEPDITAKSELFVALDRILASPILGTGTRLRALLRYLVVEELEGRGKAIKAYTIASDVFERGPDFDPQNDSIVRVEIARLRKALELYHATEGLNAVWAIEIPKGGYRPVFIRHTAAMSKDSGAVAPLGPARITQTPSPRPRPFVIGALALVTTIAAIVIGYLAWTNTQRPVATVSAPLIWVAPVSFSSDIAGFDFIANGLRGDITARLASFRWLAVSQSDESTSIGTLPGIYTVKPIIQIAGNTMRVRATLAAGPRELVDWSQVYTVPFETNLHTLLDLTQEIADKIAVDIGRPMGPVSRREFEQYRRFPDAVDQRYFCMLMFRHYWRTFSTDSQQQARSCVEDVVARDETFADGYAALSFLSLDAFRTGQAGANAGKLLEHAQAQAARALDLGPDEPLPLMAAMATAGCAGERDRAVRIGRQLVERFPLWPDVLSDAGNKVAMVGGDWKTGLELVAKATAYNTAPEPWYAITPAMRDILDKMPAAALARLTSRAQRGFEQGHLIRLAAAQLAGNAAEAEVARRRLAELGYPSREAVRGLLFAGCWSSEVTSALEPAIDAAF